MIYNKDATSALSLLMVVAVVALMGLSLARQAWLINTWSVQYSRHVINSAAKQSVLAEPPTGHARSALWLASDALQSGNPALADVLIAPQAAQGDQLALHMMVEVLLAEGDLAGAVAMWQQVVGLTSLSWTTLQVQKAMQLEGVLAAYYAAWALDPESGALPLANFLLIFRQEYHRAEDVLIQSLASYPNSKYWPLWSNRLGDALRAQKRWDEAASAYESAIIQAPDDWEAYVGLGWARYERGDGLQVAMSEFQKAINISESQGYGQFAIAQALTGEKQFEEADRWFGQALSLNPNPWWYAARGNAARQAGNLTLALAVYQETLARFPDFALAYYEIAYAYQLNEQPVQAVAAIERALALTAPPNASYYARAGKIYEWAGDESRALHAYRQSLLIDPKNVEALDGMERLDK